MPQLSFGRVHEKLLSFGRSFRVTRKHRARPVIYRRCWFACRDCTRLSTDIVSIPSRCFINFEYSCLLLSLVSFILLYQERLVVCDYSFEIGFVLGFTSGSFLWLSGLRQAEVDRRWTKVQIVGKFVRLFCYRSIAKIGYSVIGLKMVDMRMKNDTSLILTL